MAQHHFGVPPMTDIVTRLRKGWRECSPDDVAEAADEIERLRAILLEKDWHRAIGYVADYRRANARTVLLAEISVPVDQAFLDKPLADVQFGKMVTRRARFIWRYDAKEDWVMITTVRELVALTEQEIRRAPNVGKSTIKAIKSVLAEHGLHLGMEL
jgi:hypothetical protein